MLLHIHALFLIITALCMLGCYLFSFLATSYHFAYALNMYVYNEGNQVT